MNNFPAIGDEVLDPNEKFKENGIDKYDLLLADGSEVNLDTHPVLVSKLGTDYLEVGQLTASDAENSDNFGSSCSVYGDRLVVGARYEDTAESSAGKVYIYDWNGSAYIAVGQLTASDAQNSDYFGVSCSVYGDRLVVGAIYEDTAGINAGKVYIYNWNGSAYIEVGQLTASDAQNSDYFGSSCDVYKNRLVVGAMYEDTAGINAGKVYIYNWNGAEYIEVGQLTASDAEDNDYFSISCSVYENRLVVGAIYEDTAGINAGKVYIYDWNGSAYTEVGQLTASDAQYGDHFGSSCSVYGDRLVVGADTEDTAVSNAGKVYIYNWNGSAYIAVGQLTASDAQNSDYFGFSCSVYENRLVVGANEEDTAGTDTGKVYIYDSLASLPNITSPDPTCPYRVVADLTGE